MQATMHTSNVVIPLTSIFLVNIRYAEAEKTNGRWAMAACAGILFTDAVGLPNWVNAGAEVGDHLPEHAAAGCQQRAMRTQLCVHVPPPLHLAASGCAPAECCAVHTPCRQT
jgi:Chlorophyll A-B binding protein